MRENVTIAYRGASYEIGRGHGYYGIWAAGTQGSQPLQRWPETPEGWYGAWSRFIGVESPGTIAPVARPAARILSADNRAAIAAALLAVGVACGIAGLFPDYLNGANITQQPAVLIPHLIYLAI